MCLLFIYLFACLYIILVYLFICVYLFIYLFSLFICLFIYMFLCLLLSLLNNNYSLVLILVYLFICLSVYIFIYLFDCLYIYLFVCLFICLFIVLLFIYNCFICSTKEKSKLLSSPLMGIDLILAAHHRYTKLPSAKLPVDNGFASQYGSSLDNKTIIP